MGINFVYFLLYFISHVRSVHIISLSRPFFRAMRWDGSGAA
jgi:hypothetical protein